ncbi:hypothetical protein Tco_0682514 [Tanacetum coccineum]|uniref:DNA-directed primase/polymerase protein n=1 Tax=Tanacetum coccineum TaxID=301880 RepID=A0ABQ4XRM9_9ASTR
MLLLLRRGLDQWKPSQIRPNFQKIFEPNSDTTLMYVVDLQRAAYYQKCYDPDCAGYRSPLRTLLQNILPDFNMIMKENTSEDLLHENLVDSSDKDYWWHEAILVAEKVENMPRKIDFSKEDNEIWDEDNDWWIDAENKAKDIEES